MRRQHLLKLGLRTKFFLYSNAVIVATIGTVAFLADVHDRSRIFEVAARRDQKVTEALVIVLADTLERASQRPSEAPRFSARIDRYVQRIVSGSKDVVSYMMVTEPHGIVTHSSEPAQIGRSLGPDAVCSCAPCHRPSELRRVAQSLDSSHVDGSRVGPCACHGTMQTPPPARRSDPAGGRMLASTQATSEIVTRSGGGRALEFRVPLEASGRVLGTMAIGFSLSPGERNLKGIPGRLVVAALLLLLLNSVLTAIYMETLLRPILSLNKTMKRAARGDLTVRAIASRGDEVGELGAAFNGMMNDLEQANDLERARQTQLAHTEKMAAVGTLAASVAHEVSNPLGGVLTCIENMRDDPSNEALRASYLPLIQGGVERIQRTVANLLDFSRKPPLRLEPVSMNGCLRHVVELAGYQLRKAGIEVGFGLHPEDPQVTADRSQMDQLFLNLVLNALQAMPTGGTLTLNTGISDGQVFSEVRDTGAGIPPEIRDRIFDPFFTTRGAGGGTGLGLAVSDNIVAAHGGRIEVSSRPGAGAVFRVWLPHCGPGRETPA